MWANRRNFIKQSLLAGGSLAASSFPSFGQNNDEEGQRITILHTNDTHSQLQPFLMDGSKYQGCGGVAARAQLIKKIRSKNEHVLLFDAGDIFSGTPFFDLYKGEPEIKAMNLMQYDAATIGENDFTAGIDNYAAIIQRLAEFPVVICNYDLANTSLEGKTLPYKVIQKGRIKIGVTGVGIALQDYLPADLYGNIQCLDALEKANETADILKRKEGCDLVICLSHLGDKHYGNKMSDDILAKESHHIDLIIGGQTHAFFEEPRKYVNKRGKEVIVNQVGWAGIWLGRLDYNLLKNGEKIFNPKTLLIGKNYQD